MATTKDIKMEYIPKYIIVHHSAANEPNPQFLAINDWHKARRFPKSERGFNAGYHRVIEMDGSVVKARNDLERDCDALGHNFDSLSVCLVGNLNDNDPTLEQTQSLTQILSEWCNKYGITADKIYPHRHFSATSCYGEKLTDNWAAVCYLNYEIERYSDQLAELTQEK